MKRTEDAVKPVLSSALLGQATRLTAHEQRLVTFWAVMHSLVIEVAVGKVRGRSEEPESHMRWLYEHRDDREPPPGVNAWLAAIEPFVGGSFAPSLLSSGQFLHRDPQVALDTPSDSHVAAWTIGYLVLNVIAQDFRLSDLRAANGLPLANIIPTAKVAPYLLRIWPDPKSTIDWPLDKRLRVEEWVDFAEWHQGLTRFYRWRDGLVGGEVDGQFLAEAMSDLP
jgi:hypothetical protein